MPNTSVPQRRIETRASNKMAHPGDVVKNLNKKRRNADEVREEHEAKAQVKAAREEARLQSINRAAEFERADIANEDLVDATPRPLFTPKRRHSQILSDITPLAETSDVDMSDRFEKSSFVPPASEPGTEDDSTVESDIPPPPCKKPKGNPKKIVKKTAALKTKAAAKKADKRKKADRSDTETAGFDVEPPQEPKPKRVKPRMRDEIEIAAKKIEENESQETRNMYVDMVRSMSMSGKRGEKPTLEGLSLPQATAVGGKKSRRGAIANTDQITATEPDPASNSKQNNPRRGLT
jgi:hypothetical protein